MKVKELEKPEIKFLDRNKCKLCIHGDGKGHCITKEEEGTTTKIIDGFVIGPFKCDCGERFEPIDD